MCFLVVWSRVFSMNWLVFFSVAIGCFLCFVLAFGVVCWCFFVFVGGVVTCVFGDLFGVVLRQPYITSAARRDINQPPPLHTDRSKVRVAGRSSPELGNQ